MEENVEEPKSTRQEVPTLYTQEKKGWGPYNSEVNCVGVPAKKRQGREPGKRQREEKKELVIKDGILREGHG